MQEHFDKLKSNLELNDSFQIAVSQHHTAVRSLVENNHDSARKTQLIGSLQRRTKIHPRNDGTFDIDILVVMGSFNSWLPAWDPNGVSPTRAMSELHSILDTSDRYGQHGPEVDAPTVHFTYPDGIKVELVPAYVDNIGTKADGTHLGNVGRGYWIVKNGRWEIADYDHEADYISKQNELSKGHLIPSIKMMKAIRHLHFSELGSFPMEVMLGNIVPLVIAMNEYRNVPTTCEGILEESFEMLAEQIGDPIKVPGSKSDAHQLDLVTSEGLKNKFKQLQGHLAYVKNLGSKEDKIRGYKVLFGEHFPTTV